MHVKSQLTGLADRVLGSFGRPGRRGALFRKYVALFLAVVTLALLTNGVFSIWFTNQENTSALVRIQTEQAESAAAKITQFIKEIEGQIGWTTQLPWTTTTLEQRRFDGLRLLRQVPAITELTQLDRTGKERLRVSRLGMDVVGGQGDFSADPKFTKAQEKKVYYGSVYFRRESEPYMTLALAGTRQDVGVSIAEVNLKFIWDVVSQIRVGQTGEAFVVDGDGRLIAHPDISLVLRNTNLSRLEQVKAARDKGASKQRELITFAEDVKGQRVLTAYAAIAPLDWLVFVELPQREANEPLWAVVKRSAVILLGGLSLALLAGLFLAKRMVVPIQAIQSGATQIGSGDLDHRIAIKTGDELEDLANSFNEMAGQLHSSYADLEKKVEARTRELAQSVSELRVLGEVSQAVNSTLDVDMVLSTIVTKAVELSGTDAGAIYVYDESLGEFDLKATHKMPEEMIKAVTERRIRVDETAVGRAASSRAPIQTSDLDTESKTPIQEMLVAAGFRALLAVPLIGAGRVVGGLIVRRKQPGSFPDQTVNLLQTFAASRCSHCRTPGFSLRLKKRGASWRPPANTSRSSSLT